MEQKKGKRANVNRFRGIFLSFGLVTTLGLLLLAFEWSQPVNEMHALSNMPAEILDEQMETPVRTQPKPPELKPPKPKVTDVLLVTPDDFPIDESEMTIDTEAGINDYIVPDIKIKDEKPVQEPVYIVQEKPRFPGGLSALRQFLSQQVQYPAQARTDGIKGKVYVRFCVNENGAIDRVSVVRGVHPLLDNEAMRVVRTMPKWKPGSNRGVAVPVWFTLPINFQLQ